ncbi:MAG: hypothetical protein EXR66_03700 [Dehalococcoidia bacterium]|nr:hypothetical protein [Dehalococcoidia bacterium]
MDATQALNELVRIPEHVGAVVCFGTPTTTGEHTVIPVAEAFYGLGLGYGGGADSATSAQGGGGGGGGGSRSRGVAVIEVGPTGVRVHPVRDDTVITLAGVAFASMATAIVARTRLKLIRG